jgi:hypothetical protein
MDLKRRKCTIETLKDGKPGWRAVIKDLRTAQEEARETDGDLFVSGIIGHIRQFELYCKSKDVS